MRCRCFSTRRWCPFTSMGSQRYAQKQQRTSSRAGEGDSRSSGGRTAAACPCSLPLLTAGMVPLATCMQADCKRIVRSGCPQTPLKPPTHKQHAARPPSPNAPCPHHQPPNCGPLPSACHPTHGPPHTLRACAPPTRPAAQRPWPNPRPTAPTGMTTHVPRPPNRCDGER